MYETMNFQVAPMDTDGRANALFEWWKKPSSYGPTFTFPALDTSQRSQAPTDSNSVFKSSTNAFEINTDYHASNSVNNYEYGNRFQPYVNWFIKGSSKAKFKPTYGVDNFGKTSVSVRSQHLVAMPEYADQSFEEIRLEDYVASSISRTEIKNKSAPPATEHNLLNTLLQNVTSAFTQKHGDDEEMSNEPINTGSNDRTLNLLQVLLSNVKQRFDLNSISEDAKQNCEKLTRALMQFTEETLENLTVIILEDMLSNIKRRDIVKSSDVEKTETKCSPSKNTRTSKRVENVKTGSSCLKKSDKQENDVTSDCWDSQTDEAESADDEGHECKMATVKIKANRRKAASVPVSSSKTLSSVARPARHSIPGSGRSPDKVSRGINRLRRCGSERLNRCEDLYDNTDYDECFSARNGVKCHKWDAYVREAVNFIATKRNHKNFRRKKGSFKKTEKSKLDEEGRVCEQLKNVSMKDDIREERNANEEKSTCVRCKVHENALIDRVNKKIDDNYQRTEKSVSVSSLDTIKDILEQNETEVLSDSDSSSI